MLSWLALVGILAVPVGPAIADDVPDARKAVEAHGLWVKGDSLAIREETQLGQGVRAATKLRKELTASSRKVEQAQKKKTDAEKDVISLRKRSVQLNTRLARIDSRDVLNHNRLAAAINAVHGQIGLLQDQQEQLAGQMGDLRKASAKDRDAYIRHVMDMRKLADRIAREYVDKAADPEVLAAIEQLSRATGTAYELSPSRFFLESQRRLKLLEDAVQSDSVPITRKVGNALFVMVVFNGDHTQEMIVDSGASMVSLPLETAAKLGIRPTESDPTLGMQLADGRTIQGKMVRIKSIRVGKFTLENVECSVLGPEAVNALPLLGMSFLGNFKFEIDAAAGTLEMTTIEVEGSRSSRKRP
jgi:aspartyl protease family protein